MKCLWRHGVLACPKTEGHEERVEYVVNKTWVQEQFGDDDMDDDDEE